MALKRASVGGGDIYGQGHGPRRGGGAHGHAHGAVVYLCGAFAAFSAVIEAVIAGFGGGAIGQQSADEYAVVDADVSAIT
jgi:hypothetical protein